MFRFLSLPLIFLLIFLNSCKRSIEDEKILNDLNEKYAEIGFKEVVISNFNVTRQEEIKDLKNNYLEIEYTCDYVAMEECYIHFVSKTNHTLSQLSTDKEKPVNSPDYVVHLKKGDKASGRRIVQYLVVNEKLSLFTY